ncbi:MAG: phospho-sugar mutase [Clostridia bacterium]|nr:phospho-sugar mutase [Clostridia bacterium]
MRHEAAYRAWCERATADTDLGAELASIARRPQEIEDRFYRELSFGTGGLRGVIGAGPNRMNVYTVGKATQGLCDYLKQRYPAPSVAIAYDSRNKSLLFAQTAAGVFAANGIRVHLYGRLMPTPALSFAVRRLGCSGGVVITASHNPARYNGYKVYGEDGCQITTEAAGAILARIGAVHVFDGVSSLPFEQGLASGRIRHIGEEVERAYLDAVCGQSLLGADIGRDFAIVYTPLNGAGISCVPECLRRNGFTRIVIPEAQAEPDGDFPTCPFPNPEIREALAVGLACAAEHRSDLLLATDPDCDRVGVAVRDGDGYALLNGNQIGVLLLDFICKMRTRNRTMPGRPVAVKTIVTTPMAERVAARYGVELIDVLTGFKFIGEQIGLLEKRGEADRYIFGFEESYGYLSGAFVRDKDAVNASLLICEMFAYYRHEEKKSLVQALDNLYTEYGAYGERLESYTFEGAQGFRAMERAMRSLREAPPAQIGGVPVTRISDYQARVTASADGTRQPIDLPQSDVLKLALQDGSSAVIRPSGTEPKLKVYCFAQGKSPSDSEALLDELARYFGAWIKGFA